MSINAVLSSSDQIGRISSLSKTGVPNSLSFSSSVIFERSKSSASTSSIKAHSISWNAITDNSSLCRRAICNGRTRSVVFSIRFSVTLQLAPWNQFSLRDEKCKQQWEPFVVWSYLDPQINKDICMVSLEKNSDTGITR